MARLLYCVLKKAHQKAGPKKSAEKVTKIVARKVGIKFIPEPVLLLS